MVKITCATKLKDIKGKETTESVGDLLSQVMWGSRENQARSYVLATKFANATEVELKAEDVVFIKKTMQTLQVAAGGMGQILELMGENMPTEQLILFWGTKTKKMKTTKKEKKEEVKEKKVAKKGKK